MLLNVSLDCPQAAVSCYGVSAGQIAIAGDPAKIDPPQVGGRAFLGLESASNK